MLHWRTMAPRYGRWHNAMTPESIPSKTGVIVFPSLSVTLHILSDFLWGLYWEYVMLRFVRYRCVRLCIHIWCRRVKDWWSLYYYVFRDWPQYVYFRILNVIDVFFAPLLALFHICIVPTLIGGHFVSITYRH